MFEYLIVLKKEETLLTVENSTGGREDTTFQKNSATITIRVTGYPDIFITHHVEDTPYNCREAFMASSLCKTIKYEVLEELLRTLNRNADAYAEILEKEL